MHCIVFHQVWNSFLKSLHMSWKLLAPRCSASNTDHQCCTKEEKCSIGEGDCDLDDDCQEGLICGVDNCDSGFPGTEYDCCQQPLGDNIYKKSYPVWLIFSSNCS